MRCQRFISIRYRKINIMSTRTICKFCIWSSKFSKISFKLIGIKQCAIIKQQPLSLLFSDTTPCNIKNILCYRHI